jgi:hypothetical protein
MDEILNIFEDVPQEKDAIRLLHVNGRMVQIRRKLRNSKGQKILVYQAPTITKVWYSDPKVLYDKIIT